MKKNKGMKPLYQQIDYPESCSTFREPKFEEEEEDTRTKPEDFMYTGSVTCWGVAPIGVQTHQNERLRYYSEGVQSLSLRTRSSDSIQLPIIFAQFFGLIQRKRELGKINYYASQQNTQSRRQWVKQTKEQAHKNHRLKKLIQVRLDIFINKNIFNQVNPGYSQRIKDMDLNKVQLQKLKKDTQQHRELGYVINQMQSELFSEKIIRGLLMHLLDKTNLRIINRSFLKPPPRLNFMMRAYRQKTIGLITRNKRTQNRIKMKIEKWKRVYKVLGTVHFCLQKRENMKYYQHVAQDQKHVWGQELRSLKNKLDIQTIKLKLRNGFSFPSDSEEFKVLEQSRKKLMQEMGANGFDQNQSGSDSEDQGNQQKALMKKNETLMQKFQKQNKHFRQHSNPPMLVSVLKPYQRQALQWMKFRQAKITVDQLFQKEYINQIQQLDYERKLSPFWEEIQLINQDKFYMNYLTGEFTKKFYDWKSIKGGILADEMGLGKTVMTLALLADQQFQGLNLIVVPVSVILQWKDQIQKHCGPQITVFQFHSKSKSRRKVDLQKFQIVLITYATLGHEYRSYTQNRQKDVKYLFDYNFRRVILDEAQNIKGTKTLMFHGVMNLQSSYSWCLTGTLIQNSEQDLFAIFKFLRVEVFSQEYWWNQYIKNSGCTQAKLNVIQTVLRPIVLRRTKASTSQKGQIILKLKEKKQSVIRPQFSQAELKIYKKLQAGVRSFFKSISNSTKNYTHVFQIIAKLRQFCCHPALIFGRDAQNIQETDIQGLLHKFLENKVSGKNYRETAVNTMLDAGNNCVICMEQPDQINAVLTECGHYFCEPCLLSSLKRQPVCPICRANLGQNSYIKKSDVKSQQIPIQMKNATQSSKLKAIFKVIDEIRSRKQKCVIFTQWISIISLIEQKLIEKQIQYGIIKGDVPVKKRQKVIKTFRDDKYCQFLIVSIKAGGTGLNLAFANNVMICDPWWNPSHQDQAIGRVHRMGQQKDVNVYRFIMRSSIEQKIQKMHVRKKQLADQVMMQKGSLRQKKQGGGAQQLIRLLE